MSCIGGTAAALSRCSSATAAAAPNAWLISASAMPSTASATPVGASRASLRPASVTPVIHNAMPTRLARPSRCARNALAMRAVKRMPEACDNCHMLTGRKTSAWLPTTPPAMEIADNTPMRHTVLHDNAVFVLASLPAVVAASSKHFSGSGDLPGSSRMRRPASMPRHPEQRSAICMVRLMNIGRRKASREPSKRMLSVLNCSFVNEEQSARDTNRDTTATAAGPMAPRPEVKSRVMGDEMT
mmetsp:Transcript_29734/g.84810  ORF Transcript_29734/g.84810 Transcript_29734/m.84810 type:complete len:242 (+) Transcript_29734:691-1416(+)